MQTGLERPGVAGVGGEAEDVPVGGQGQERRDVAAGEPVVVEDDFVCIIRGGECPWACCENERGQDDAE